MIVTGRYHNITRVYHDINVKYHDITRGIMIVTKKFLTKKFLDTEQFVAVGIEFR